MSDSLCTSLVMFLKFLSWNTPITSIFTGCFAFFVVYLYPASTENSHFGTVTVE